MKCNTDCARKGNSGKSAYDFCIRNNDGNLIYAQAKGIRVTTNIEAEARAIQEALYVSAKEEFQNLVIETDSMSLKKIILKIWRVPWELTEILEDIIKKVQLRHITIKHIYKEGNQMTDYLANLAINNTEVQEFRHFTDLPVTGRQIISIDTTQIPNIMIKTKHIKSHAD